MELIKRGAEADILKGDWGGEDSVYKIRRCRPYMEPSLDATLRRRRTLRESHFISRARTMGIPTPIIFFVDGHAGEIVMEYIDGSRLRELLQDGNLQHLKAQILKVGQYIAIMHNGGMIHGDLTTSNFIVDHSGSLVLIDFGLSFYSRREEDRAVELHLLKGVLASGHQPVSSLVFDGVLQGYSQLRGQPATEGLRRRIGEIESRARYTKVD